MNIDYRELLKKYMRHVIDCEGVSFVEGLDQDREGFTPEEVAELQQVKTEVVQ